jgi:hypothetical protein
MSPGTVEFVGSSNAHVQEVVNAAAEVGAVCSSNSAGNAAIARITLIRPGSRFVSGSVKGDSILSWPSHEPVCCNKATTDLASSQSAVPVCLRLNFPPNRAGDVDHARAFFPSAPSLFKLAGSSVFGARAFTSLAVASIEVEGHATLHSRCTALRAIARPTG